jgi:hypothetical protein
MFGPWSFAVFLGVVAVVCAYEVCVLAPGLYGRHPLTVCAVVLAVALALAGLLPISSAQAGLLVTAPLIVSLLILLGYAQSGHTFGQWSWSVAGALYIGWLLGHWGPHLPYQAAETWSSSGCSPRSLMTRSPISPAAPSAVTSWRHT